jgi:hypothetical protein
MLKPTFRKLVFQYSFQVLPLTGFLLLQITPTAIVGICLLLAFTLLFVGVIVYFSFRNNRCS